MTKKRDTDNQSPEAVSESVAFWEQDGDLLHKVAEVPRRYRDSIYALIQESGQSVHPNAEPVRVVSVDEAEAKKWFPPRNHAQPCQEEHLFPSAIAASLHLGFKHNEVGQRLSKARKEAELKAAKTFGPEHTVRLRPTTTVRGVTLQYEKDVPG